MLVWQVRGVPAACMTVGVCCICWADGSAGSAGVHCVAAAVRGFQSVETTQDHHVSAVVGSGTGVFVAGALVAGQA